MEDTLRRLDTACALSGRRDLCSDCRRDPKMVVVLDPGQSGLERLANDVQIPVGYLYGLKYRDRAVE